MLIVFFFPSAELAMTDIRTLSVKAFQRLWNRFNPKDKIAEDGEYGPLTESKLKKSPAKGFFFQAPTGIFFFLHVIVMFVCVMCDVARDHPSFLIFFCQRPLPPLLVVCRLDKVVCAKMSVSALAHTALLVAIVQVNFCHHKLVPLLCLLLHLFVSSHSLCSFVGPNNIQCCIPVTTSSPAPSSSQTTNAAGVDLIKSFEGFYANFYIDPVGIKTIGYGHACHVNDCSNLQAKNANGKQNKFQPFFFNNILDHKGAKVISQLRSHH